MRKRVRERVKKRESVKKRERVKKRARGERGRGEREESDSEGIECLRQSKPGSLNW